MKSWSLPQSRSLPQRQKSVFPTRKVSSQHPRFLRIPIYDTSGDSRLPKRLVTWHFLHRVNGFFYQRSIHAASRSRPKTVLRNYFCRQELPSYRHTQHRFGILVARRSHAARGARSAQRVPGVLGKDSDTSIFHSDGMSVRNVNKPHMHDVPNYPYTNYVYTSHSRSSNLALNQLCNGQNG